MLKFTSRDPDLATYNGENFRIYFDRVGGDSSAGVYGGYICTHVEGTRMVAGAEPTPYPSELHPDLWSWAQEELDAMYDEPEDPDNAA